MPRDVRVVQAREAGPFGAVDGFRERFATGIGGISISGSKRRGRGSVSEISELESGRLSPRVLGAPDGFRMCAYTVPYSQQSGHFESCPNKVRL